MSLRGLLDELVTIIPMNIGSDRWGSEEWAPGEEIPDVPARFDQRDSDEELRNRDQVATNYLAFFDDDVALSDKDRIRRADGELLEVDGDPDQVHGRAGVHHLEVKVRKVVG